MQDIIFFINNNLLLSSAWIMVLAILIAIELKSKLYGPKKLECAELTNLVNKQDALLYDIRARSDYSKGHISGAINFELSDLNNAEVFIQKITKDLKKQDKPVILVCKDSMQSSKLAAKLKSSGIINISFLSGGMNAWMHESLPVITS